MPSHAPGQGQGWAAAGAALRVPCWGTRSLLPSVPAVNGNPIPPCPPCPGRGSALPPRQQQAGSGRRRARAQSRPCGTGLGAAPRAGGGPAGRGSGRGSGRGAAFRRRGAAGGVLPPPSPVPLMEPRCGRWGARGRGGRSCPLQPSSLPRA